MRRKKKLLGVSLTTAIPLIIIGILIFVFKDLIQTAIRDLLLKIGVTNFYLQSLIMIVVLLSLLVAFGFGFTKLGKKIMKRW